MDKRAKIILWLFAVVLLAIIVAEAVRPRPLNWLPSYTSTDKIPYGCYVLFNELEQLFPNTSTDRITRSSYEQLSQLDSLETSTYLFINNSLYLDQESSEKLLDFVKRGNTAFIAATYLSEALADSLNFSTNPMGYGLQDSIALRFTNPHLHQKTFGYPKTLRETYISSVDTLHTQILGYMEYEAGKLAMLDEEMRPKGKLVNFIKTSYGKGAFYINTAPIAFTNYYMLNGNAPYVADALSYLPDHKIYWDEYIKDGKVVISSPLRFVLNQTALKCAYYLGLLGILLFMVFRAKREQRIIPIIPPLENSSVAFAQTVGALYYQHRNYSDLIAKKMGYFNEFLRSHYQVDLSTKDAAKLLAAKAGKPLDETEKLVEFMAYLRNRPQHSEQDLTNLTKKINAFKQ